MCLHEMLIGPSNHTFTHTIKRNILNLKLVKFATKRKVSTKPLSTRISL